MQAQAPFAWLDHLAFSPYIRRADYGVRTKATLPLERRLLDYQLFYVEEGTCFVRQDGKEYRFAPGDFGLLQPDTPHSHHIPEGGIIFPFLHLDLFYNPDRASSYPIPPGRTDLSALSRLIQPRLNDMPGVRIPVLFRPSRHTHFKDTLNKAIGLWSTLHPLEQAKANQLAAELVLELVGLFSEEHSAADIQTPESLNWITSYLMLHLNEPISVADMAERARLSRSRFSALFKRQYGCGPYDYLLRLRIRHAGELLKETKLTLGEIAYSCGFADLHHLSKAFKRHTGMAPGEYRAALEKKSF